MSLTVEKYLIETKNPYLVKSPVFVQETDHFDHVLKFMIQNHIHRVYVVDAQQKPVGVYSTTDVMQHLLA